MADVIGEERDFFDKFKFRVEIDSIPYAFFTKCSALEVEVGKVEHREGGRLVAQKSPGLLNYSDITLEQGACRDDALWTWFNHVADATQGLGGRGRPNPLYKRNLDIVQLGREDEELLRWNLQKAWPVKFVAGEWDNSSEEKVITSVTLTFELMKRVLRG